MREKQSKAARVKEVRRVLAQFGVDVQKLHLSVYSSSLDLSGSLVKYDGSELVYGEVNALVKALADFGQLSSTLAEWDLTNGDIIKLSQARSNQEKG